MVAINTLQSHPIQFYRPTRLRIKDIKAGHTMEHLLEFYTAARAHGDIGVHVIYHTGTSVRVGGGVDGHTRDAAIAAANAAITAVPADYAPVHLKDTFYIVQLVGANIHVIVGADSLAAATAIAKDALQVDREDKKVFAVVWGDGTLDVAV